MRARFTVVAGAAADLAGRAVRRAPGIAAMVCACVGVAFVTSWPWALITAVPFLLVLDHRSV